jgi:hypothetical protein
MSIHRFISRIFPFNNFYWISKPFRIYLSFNSNSSSSNDGKSQTDITTHGKNMASKTKEIEQDIFIIFCPVNAFYVLLLASVYCYWGAMNQIQNNEVGQNL